MADLIWSYPDATTGVVPTDAVFRGFVQINSGVYGSLLEVEVDGRKVPSSATGLEVDVPPEYPDDSIEFRRLARYPIESSEFVPPEPLSPGEHEVVFRVLGHDYTSGGLEERASHRFTVRAEEQPQAASNVEISAVTGYTWNYASGPAQDYPPAEALDGVCETTARLYQYDCGNYYNEWSGPPRLDLIDGSPATHVEIPPGTPFEARVDIAASGPALGYLIGSQFVLAGCSAVMHGGTSLVWDEPRVPPSAVAFYAQAVLPTGLGEPNGFTGEVPIVEGSRTRPSGSDYPQSHSGLCSVHTAGARTSGSDLAALALFVASTALLRRSRRARQFPPRA